MFRKSRAFFLSLTILAVVLFSAVGTTTVFADDGTTTDPSTVETGVDGSGPAGTDPGTVTDGELPPASEPGTGETPVVPALDGAPSEGPVDPAVEPVVSETPVPGDESSASSVADLIAGVPDNTSIVVLDADGQTEPLATQEAADAIPLSDPVWCPEGQAPTPNNNGCTGSFTSFSLLLSHLKANESDPAYQQAGTIYVQMGNYTTSETSVDFNTYGFTSLDNYDLTIQGGWDTSGSSIDTTTGSSLHIPLTIGSNANPWAGSITLNNISFSNISNHAAVTVNSQSDINLTDVNITNINNGNAANLVSTNGDVTISGGSFNNSAVGAVINAGNDVTIQDDAEFNNNKKAGADITAGGTVNVSNAFFNNNGSSSNTGKGLDIKSGSSVSLFEVEANNNQAYGANIQANDSVVVSSSFFSGNKSYTSSCKGGTIYGGYGLEIVSTQSITLFDVTASSNMLFGASLAAPAVQVNFSTIDNNGSGANKTPVGKGLLVNSSGTASLVGVEANNNQLFGANIQAAGQVSITNSVFSGNKSYTSSCKGGTYDGYGLQVVTTGPIFLSAVTAKDNNLFGASLTGTDVFISSNSVFSHNGTGLVNVPLGKGLIINSSGLASLANVEANDNQIFGADIHAKNDVSIIDGFFSGNASYSSSCQGKTFFGYGLQVTTDTNIVLGQVTANNNNLWGASLNGANVTVTNSQFDNNVSDSYIFIDDTGLLVKSTGNVTLINTEANKNRLIGASIVATGDVIILNSFFSNNRGYTCNDGTTCHKIVYHGYGLQVVTPGHILLDGVTANENNLFGASLNGSEVTVTNSSFSMNGSGSSSSLTGQGLIVKSASTATLSGVEANNNQLFGANVTAKGPVNVTNSFFNGHQYYTSSCNGNTSGGYGLQVVTDGDIALDQVTASNNGVFGASLTTSSNVSVSNSTFNLNKGNGLLIKTPGVVTLTNVVATNNGLNGVQVIGACATTVNVDGGTYSNNGKYGLYTTGATVSLTNSPAFVSNGSGSIFQNPTNCSGSVTTANSNNHNKSNHYGHHHSSNHHHHYSGHRR